ncbi:transient receptor potential cation channel subfamily V member 1-like [Babylonia areolata]|uniref:transient receptor potential cation channel subfamily V member 1-like n=1 Tax=Babylonia areolata TaxID=304850 RepID=UPI003FD3E0D6
MEDTELRPRKKVRSGMGDTDISAVPSSRVSGSSMEMTNFHCSLTSQSLCDVIGQDVADDTFQAEVAHKTSKYMVGRQEAETEVIIDRLIQREGDRDRALLFVVSQIPTEVKVQVMVNTLLQRGANPSVCDGEWQTPLHHATRRAFKGVVSKLLDNDALPHSRDKAGHMPLHIAIHNSADDIGALLLAFMPNTAVRPLFIRQNDKPAELCLHDLIKQNMQQTALAVLDCMIDPIGQSGHVRVHYHVLEADENGRAPNHDEFIPTSKSCLHLISQGGYKNYVNHDVVRLLIRRKWKEFARFRFQINCFLFILTQMCLGFCAVVATVTPDPTVYSGPLHITRAVLEVWSVAAVIMTLLLELNQMRKHRVDYFKDQFNWIDLLSSLFLLTVVALRWTHRNEQWPFFSVGFLLWTLRIFKYAAVFRQTGAYAQILWRIVAHDFPQFLVLFAIILISFSGSFVLALRGEDSLHVHNETSSFGEIMFTGVRILIEGQPVVDYTGPYGYKTLSCILMVVFLFTCCVVLLNILIAQLSDTYQHVQRDAQRGLELNRAWIIARVELNSVYITGKGYRQSRYREVEEMGNPLEVLKKWESAPLTETNKYVRDIWDSLESHKLNLLTIKNRMARQEYALCKIQGQMDTLVDLMTRMTKPTDSTQAVTSDLAMMAEEDLPEALADGPPHFQ